MNKKENIKLEIIKWETAFILEKKKEKDLYILNYEYIWNKKEINKVKIFDNLKIKEEQLNDNLLEKFKTSFTKTFKDWKINNEDFSNIILKNKLIDKIKELFLDLLK